DGADAAPAVERAAPAAEGPAPAATQHPAPAAAAQVVEERRPDGAARLETTAAEPTAAGPAAAEPAASAAKAPATPSVVTLQQLRDAWPEILEVVQGIKRSSW